ncbi:hypothetical protein L1987_39554 [Smallanthus sonchifolius]|uniref:Uncharacterized protein n=1 Tax=Smallanthus sonchifolius TaxID=185202 RepID=A0ACB9HLP3_9ASTR|nr:hypothetical protein L1987_39554 [Smallanthus sonchifolius]
MFDDAEGKYDVNGKQEMDLEENSDEEAYHIREKAYLDTYYDHLDETTQEEEVIENYDDQDDTEGRREVENDGCLHEDCEAENLWKSFEKENKDESSSSMTKKRMHVNEEDNIQKKEAGTLEANGGKYKKRTMQLEIFHLVADQMHEKTRMVMWRKKMIRMKT